MKKPDGFDERTEQAMDNLAKAVGKMTTKETIANPAKWVINVENLVENMLRDKHTSEDIFYLAWNRVSKELQTEMAKQILLKLLSK